MKQADDIRKFALESYIAPARARGDQTVTIRAGDVHNSLHLAQAHAAVTAALGAFKFRDLAKVELVKREGPEAGANVFFTFDLGARATANESIASASRPTTIQASKLFTEAGAHSIRGSSSFSVGNHFEAVRRRRIKFVVEKGSMVRLFKRGVHRQLQDQLFDLIDPARLITIASVEEYDAWLDALIVDDRWKDFSRNGLEADRYGYFAKLVNIIVYEVASNRELLADADWQRLKMWLHVPLDSMVFAAIQSVLPPFPIPATLRGMKSDEYWTIQKAVRQLARKLGIPPVWFDDAWSP